MKISVNLATRPYVELRPIFLRLRIFMAALAVLGAAALIASHVLQQKLNVAEGRIDAAHVKVAAAQQEKRDNERRMHEPVNAAVLARAHFLNALFLRKSFSWTAVMMDLETVLPSGVQVTSIEPEPTSTGEVMIRLRVSGDRDRSVQLVRNLERSKRFLAPRLTGEAAQTKENGAPGNGPMANRFAASAPADLAPPGVEFEILASYNPLPVGENFGNDKAAEKKEASKEAAQRAHSPKAAGAKAGGGHHRAMKPSPATLSPAKPAPAAAAKGGAR
jgi:type IV pilus assembly protein PilN